MPHTKSKVYVQFPKTGLGNLMLIWARACVFAHLNDLPLITSSWWAFRWGSWFRNEKRKRLYWGYFKENTLLETLMIQYFRLIHKVVHEPLVKKINGVDDNQLFLFDQVISDNDLFGSIRNYSNLLEEKIYQILNPKLKKQLDGYETPVISVHIRRGDFKIGNPITPELFFIQSINEIRRSLNENWPVTIFTDADVNEIKEVMALPNTYLATPKADILDILLMSKSKFIVLSQSSTFSYWAAFLSDAVVIRPAGDWQLKIKDSTSNYIEVQWNPSINESELKFRKQMEKILLFNHKYEEN